jgi:hypothetical protein
MGSGDRAYVEAAQVNSMSREVEVKTYILMSTIPSDQTSAARGEYVGATLFLHSTDVHKKA